MAMDQEEYFRLLQAGINPDSVAQCLTCATASWRSCWRSDRGDGGLGGVVGGVSGTPDAGAPSVGGPNVGEHPRALRRTLQTLRRTLPSRMEASTGLSAAIRRTLSAAALCRAVFRTQVRLARPQAV
jgi:hypothetical protein